MGERDEAARWPEATDEALEEALADFAHHYEEAGFERGDEEHGAPYAQAERCKGHEAANRIRSIVAALKADRTHYVPLDKVREMLFKMASWTTANRKTKATRVADILLVHGYGDGGEGDAT